MKYFSVLAILTALFLASCSSADEEPAEVEPETPDSLGDEVEDESLLAEEEVPDVDTQSEQEWAQELALSWEQNNNSTPEQAECVGEQVVEQIGIERLLELGVRIEDVNGGMTRASFTDEEGDTIGAISASCEG